MGEPTEQGWLHNLGGLMQNENVGTLVQNYQKFQDGDKGALSQA